MGEAGTRGHIECDFEAIKDEARLDACDTCSTTGWYRHMTLSWWTMLWRNLSPSGLP